jgi:hypothetical protein
VSRISISSVAPGLPEEREEVGASRNLRFLVGISIVSLFCKMSDLSTLFYGKKKKGK